MKSTKKNYFYLINLPETLYSKDCKVEGKKDDKNFLKNAKEFCKPWIFISPFVCPLRLITSLKMVRFNEDGEGRGPRCYCHTCSKHESGVYVFLEKIPPPF